MILSFLGCDMVPLCKTIDRPAIVRRPTVKHNAKLVHLCCKQGLFCNMDYSKHSVKLFIQHYPKKCVGHCAERQIWQEIEKAGDGDMDYWVSKLVSVLIDSNFSNKN